MLRNRFSTMRGYGFRVKFNELRATQNSMNSTKLPTNAQLPIEFLSRSAARSPGVRVCSHCSCQFRFGARRALVVVKAHGAGMPLASRNAEHRDEGSRSSAFVEGPRVERRTTPSPDERGVLGGRPHHPPRPLPGRAVGCVSGLALAPVPQTSPAHRAHRDQGERP